LGAIFINAETGKIMKVVGRIRLLIVMLVIALLIGCSSGAIINTYSGDTLPASELAILNSPENIILLSVNGREVKQYLLSDLNVNYGLKSGENTVIFRYESLWGKAKKAGDSARSETVASDPQELIIIAKPGQEYHFSFNGAGNVREARALAKSFSANIYDLNNVLIAKSQGLGVSERAKLSETEKTSDSSVMDALTALWGKASAEEKKKFLAWVFQE